MYTYVHSIDSICPPSGEYVAGLSEIVPSPDRAGSVVGYLCRAQS